MSIWTDIQSRSAGGDLRKEEFHKIYPGELPKENLLDSGKYKDGKYMIFTSGKYPYIGIIFPLEMSIFSGSSKVILKDNNKQYGLSRQSLDKYVHFCYECNKDGDYILGEQDGYKYGLDELKQMAEKFIDLILNAENRLIDYKD